MIINSVIKGGSGGGTDFLLDIAFHSILPASVTNNQIAVVTDVVPNKITFSYATPESPTGGDLWIHTVDNDGYALPAYTADYGALIKLVPGATMQFNGTIWEYRNAYIGIDGVWKMFSTQSPLADLSWAQIIAIANSGEDPSLFFAVGDKKNLTYNGNPLFSAIIGGFNLNTIVGTSKTAALAFTSKHCDDALAWNTSGSVIGGWKDSTLRSYGMQQFITRFPAELTADNAIKTVYVKTACDGSVNPTTTQDKLRPHSLTELSVTHQNTANSVEGVAYPYYSAGNRIKTNLSGTSVNYWTRTRYNSGTSYAMIIPINGIATINQASNAASVHVCFDI